MLAVILPLFDPILELVLWILHFLEALGHIFVLFAYIGQILGTL